MDMKNKNTFQIAAAATLAVAIAAVAAGPEATGGSRDWAAKVAAPKATPTLPEGCPFYTLAECQEWDKLERASWGKRVARDGESYSEFTDRQAQRNNDLAYCRQNPNDWSCREGQYKGQY